MEPTFIVMIVVVVFTFAGILGVKGMELERLKILAKSRPDNSLGASELKGMIQQAVEEANAPLQARIVELEARLEEQEVRELRAASRRRELKAADVETSA